MGWNRILMEFAKKAGIYVAPIVAKHLITRIPNGAAKTEQRLRDIESCIANLEESFAKTQAQSEKAINGLVMWLTVSLIWCAGLTVFVAVLAFKCWHH
jgi:hypothetical protein